MPLKLRQMSSRPLGPAIRTVEIDRRRRIGSAPGPVIAGVDPEPAGLGAAAAGIEHRDRRVVGEQRLRGEDVLGEPGLQRLQPPDGSADPVGERRAIQLDALPGEDLALPVERKVIAVFGDQDMGEQSRGGQALGDRTLRGRRLMDRPAGPAAIARPADADDPQPRRHMVEHLADGLADQVQLAAAAGAGLMLDIEPHVLARQVRRQARPVGLRLGRLASWLGAGGSLASTRARSTLEVFKAELQLIVIEPLGAPAELAALQLLDDELQPLDLGLRLGESGALGRKRAHHAAAASPHRPAGRQDRCP